MDRSSSPDACDSQLPPKLGQTIADDLPAKETTMRLLYQYAYTVPQQQ